jgi:hypothetical protein
MESSTNFLSLPLEIRHQIYEHILIFPTQIMSWHLPRNTHSHGLCEWTFSGWSTGLDHEEDTTKFGSLTPGLLRTNKQIYHEAAGVLYGRNVFELYRDGLQSMKKFFELIGCTNASSIRHLRIEFPYINSLKAGEINLEDNGIKILELIKTKCTQLRTLTTELYSTIDMEEHLAEDTPETATAALEMVNCYFKTLFPLVKIILEVPTASKLPHVRKEIERLGWLQKNIDCS